MSSADKYDLLKLENQMCFPLYVCAKEVVRKYKPFLDKIDLTYTQYIAMMVMWEKKQVNVKELGEYLYLDSGTLTPLLKKLQAKGYIDRCRSDLDERAVIISITKKGEALRDEAVDIPMKMGQCIDISVDEMKTLIKVLYKIIGEISR